MVNSYLVVFVEVKYYMVELGEYHIPEYQRNLDLVMWLLLQASTKMLVL